MLSKGFKLADLGGDTVDLEDMAGKRLFADVEINWHKPIAWSQDISLPDDDGGTDNLYTRAGSLISVHSTGLAFQRQSEEKVLRARLMRARILG